MTPKWLPRGGTAPEPGTVDERAPHPEADSAGGQLASQEPDSADEPASDDPASDEPASDDPGDTPAPRPPHGRLRRAALAGTAAVLLLGGCGFFYAAHRLASAEAARNHALTDTEATSRVAGDIGNALARVFSYTPDGTAAAERSAATVLDGRAARQYETLFARVRDDLTEQRVTLSTRAVRTGVIELDGDRARLLVFLDQTSHKGKDSTEVTTAAAQLTVTARLEDDRWRITDIKAR
ncbi:nuclear transport factor 2 family protein [Streptomyces sp. AC602_WCS936]|uniref:nuclear transport factor 2 family protein n=1 Tax=Streptomyces sp. AC602_WCS936 TaxID=2823685 RepID=UPI001C2746BC|nr:nuclear transport factor 2 family protein [Streptomyces sp. AC602_WCS936]